MNPTTITPDSNHSAVDNFKGYSIYEDAGAPALVIFRKAAVGGQIIWVQALAANGSASVLLPNIPAEGGVYVQESTGSVTGVLYGD